MNTVEKIKERLHELRRQRIAERNKIEKLVSKYRDQYAIADHERRKTANDPDKSKEHAAAVEQMEEADKRLEELKARWHELGNPGAIQVDPEETKAIFDELRTEYKSVNIDITQRALELSEKLFDLAKEAYLTENDMRQAINSWKSCADYHAPDFDDVMAIRIDSEIMRPYTQEVYLSLWNEPITSIATAHFRDVLNSLTK